MDPMTLMLLASAAAKMMDSQGNKGASAGPQAAPAQAPQIQPIQNISANPMDPSGGMGGAMDLGMPPALALGGGALDQLPGAASTGQEPVASPLSALSMLGGSDLSQDDVAIGEALIGGAGAPTPGATAPPSTGAAVPTSSPGAPPTAGQQLQGLLSGLGGVKAPEPIKPIMSGGNVGGVKPPEVAAKMGSSVTTNPLLQMLFAGGGGPRGLPVPALGNLLRGA